MLINKLLSPIHVFYVTNTVISIQNIVEKIKHSNIYLHVINKNKTNKLVINALHELLKEQNPHLFFRNIYTKQDELQYLKYITDKYKEAESLVFTNKSDISLESIESILSKRVSNEIVSNNEIKLTLDDIINNNYETCICDISIMKKYELSKSKSETVKQPAKQPVKQPVRQPVRPRFISRRSNMGMMFG